MAKKHTVTIPAFDIKVKAHGDKWHTSGFFARTREEWESDPPDSQLGEHIAKAIVAFIDSQPITLEHREGEYVHVGCGWLFQFADGEWRTADSDAPTFSAGAVLSHVTDCELISHGFLTPGTITAPQPPEPTTYGYVGTVVTTDGHEYDVARDNSPSLPYVWMRQTDGSAGAGHWSDVLALGTFEAVTK